MCSRQIIIEKSPTPVAPGKRHFNMEGSPVEGRNVWDVKKLLEVKARVLTLATAARQHANILQRLFFCRFVSLSSSVWTSQKKPPTSAWLTSSPTRTLTKGRWAWPTSPRPNQTFLEVSVPKVESCRFTVLL